MSGIAGIVDWRGLASEVELRRMLRSIEHRGPDGLELETAGGVGLGHARLTLRGGRYRERQPLWLPDRSCAVIADARLYNRQEIRRALGRVEWLREPASDAALILAAYERWKEELLPRLRGDFAFAIWNRGDRRLFAARDPFGAKPFFYTVSSERFCFGSEPKQLLILPAVSVEPDGSSVAEFLLDRMGARRRTFFRGIERLRAGHSLHAHEGRVVQEPYWEPRAEAPLPGQPREAYLARLRELLFDAVERRLGIESAVCLELSGGLDSSSLVVAAAEIYRRSGRGLPEAATISAVFPGREFDESPFVDAVANRVPFASHRITPIREPLAPDLMEEMWTNDSPDADPACAWKHAAEEILSSLGARVLISGTGGDELFWDPDYLLGLAARKRWSLALRYLRSRAEGPRPILTRSLAGLLGRRPEAAPAAAHEWIRPELIAELRGQPAREVPTARPDLPSGQQTILDWLSEPRFHYVLEQNEARWGRHGVELRHPFLDRELAEFVLATPVEIRASMGGAAKAYLASALSALLPRGIVDRERKTAYDGYHGSLAKDSRPRIGEMLRSERPWACERYVRRSGVRALLARTASDDRSWSAVRPLWAVACLEVWLRQLPRYEKIGQAQPAPSRREVQSA